MKKNKKKLIKAFEEYVNSLSDTDMRDFNINIKGGVESNMDDSAGFFYEVLSAPESLIGHSGRINMLAFNNAEKRLYGKPVDMDDAKDWCKREYTKRGGTEANNLERSVYFSYKNIDDWKKDVIAKYPNTPMVGFRVYFAGYPPVLPADGEIDLEYANRSTVVLRAMYFKEDGDGSGSFLKIPWNDADATTDKDILTFNLGGLCPPKCQDDSEI